MGDQFAFSDEAIEVIASLIEKHQQAYHLTDQELAHELINHVWGDMDMGTWEEALIFSAIERLDGTHDR